MDKATKALAQKVSAVEKLVHGLRDAPRQQDGQTASNRHEANRKDDGLDEAAPRLRNRNPTPVSTDDADKKWYQSFKGWKSRIQFAALIAGIVYALITWLQWHDLRHNFSIDERAWLQITVSEPLIPLDQLKSTAQPVVIKNVGKSPAMGMAYVSGGEVLANNMAPSFNYRDGTTITTGSLFQNTPADGMAGGLTEFTASQRAALAEGRAYIVVYGTVTFRDIFGAAHWTKFCHFRAFSFSAVTKTIPVKSCTDYNTTDND